MSPLPDISRHLQDKEGFCHPNWEAIDRQIEKSVAESDLNGAWEAAARQWLSRLGDQLGKGYQFYETANFMIVSQAPKPVMINACNFFEKALTHILSALSGVALLDQGYGKRVVLMFSLPEQSYKYISYFDSAGEHRRLGRNVSSRRGIRVFRVSDDGLFFVSRRSGS